MKRIVILTCVLLLFLTSCFASEYSEQSLETIERWYEPLVYVTDPELITELNDFAFRKLKELFPSLTEDQLGKFECFLPICVFQEDSQEVWYVNVIYAGVQNVSIDFHIIRDKDGVLQLKLRTPYELDKLVELMDSCMTEEIALAVASKRLDAKLSRCEDLHPDEMDKIRFDTGYALLDSSEFEHDSEFWCMYNQGEERPNWCFYFEMKATVDDNGDSTEPFLLYRAKIDAQSGDVISETFYGFLLELH